MNTALHPSPSTAASPAAATAANAAQRFARLLGKTGSVDSAEPVAKPYAMRVVAGLHRGATLRLCEATLLGSHPSNDILLRDPEVRPRHAEIRWVDGCWRLFDLQDGQPIVAFETGRRGRFTRGRHVLGGAQIVITQPAPLEPAAPARRKPPAQIVAPLLIFLAASVGAVAIVQLMTPVTAGIVSGIRNLADEGFPDVELAAVEGASPVARGYVDDGASLTRLQRWLNARNVGHATVMVRVGTELATRVREALGEPSLAVDYRPGGSVRVQGSSDKLAVRERLRRMAVDLAGTVRIDDRVAFIEEPDRTPKKFVLPFRIVDVRPGYGDNTGSFGNDSGARYFVGAVLPDGAEVVAINDDGIEFSIAGRSIKYPLK